MSTNVSNPYVTLESIRLRIFIHALFFVAGFSLIFIVGWGGSVTLVGQFFGVYKRVIAQIGGVIVIMFGLTTLELIRLPWFYADTRTQRDGTGTRPRGDVGIHRSPLAALDSRRLCQNVPG